MLKSKSHHFGWPVTAVKWMQHSKHSRYFSFTLSLKSFHDIQKSKIFNVPGESLERDMNLNEHHGSCMGSLPSAFPRLHVEQSSNRARLRTQLTPTFTRTYSCVRPTPLCLPRKPAAWQGDINHRAWVIKRRGIGILGHEGSCLEGGKGV